MSVGKAYVQAMSTADPQARLCVICGKPQVGRLSPFCSKRCADVDLHRWLSGSYAIPATEDEEEDERREDSGEQPN
jgi:uncharacterized protein